MKKILATCMCAVTTLAMIIPSYAAVDEIESPVNVPDDALSATGIYENSVGSTFSDKDATSVDDVTGKDFTQGKTSQYQTSAEMYLTEMPDTSIPVDVYATQVPSFTVRIPKTIILSSNGDAEFSVGLKGDISGAQTVNIVPDTSFDMSEVIPGTVTKVDAASAKDDITATVAMTDTEWKYVTDLDGTSKGTYAEHEGSIAAPDISAGSWAGVFNFTISLDCVKA